MGGKKVLFSMHIEADMYESLRELAEKDDRSMSWEARDAIKKHLNDLTVVTKQRAVGSTSEGSD